MNCFMVPYHKIFFFRHINSLIIERYDKLEKKVNLNAIWPNLRDGKDFELWIFLN